VKPVLKDDEDNEFELIVNCYQFLVLKQLMKEKNQYL